MYFDNLIEKIKNIKNINNEQNNKFNIQLLNSIINPFSPYFLCDHFIGIEYKFYNIPIPINKNNILISNNLSIINNYDIIFVEVKLFKYFIINILPRINKKFILLTGQWHAPQIYISDDTNKILLNNNIILWISQNPIYSNNSKYIAFPYGICHTNINNYANELLNNTNKIININNLPLNYNTNSCREKLPKLPLINIKEYS